MTPWGCMSHKATWHLAACLRYGGIKKAIKMSVAQRCRLYGTNDLVKFGIDGTNFTRTAVMQSYDTGVFCKVA